MIDFKGYKYAVVTIQGGVISRTEIDLEAHNIASCDMGHKVIKNPNYKEEKQMDSIYTQEMHKAGELPKIGMMFFDSTKNYNQTVLAVTRFDGRDILTVHNDNFIVDAINFCTRYIKPVDTRTDKEKAIDDLKASYDEWENVSNEQDTFAWILDDIKAGKIHGVTLTENKND